MQIKEWKEIKELKTMYMGSERLLVHLDVVLSGFENIAELETVLENIREKVRKKVPVVYSIHIEPKAC